MIKLITWIVPTLLALVFFVWIVTPPSYFNFLPYAVHESLFQGSGYEAEFILVFDACSAIVLFLGLRFIARRFAGNP